MSEQTIAKRVLADRIAARLNLPQGQTLQVIQSFLDEIVDELGHGNRLEFRAGRLLKAKVKDLGVDASGKPVPPTAPGGAP